MLEPLKRTFLASLGVVALTKDRLQRTIDELVEKGELTREQGKRVFELMVQRGEAEGQGLMERISHELQRLIGGGPVVTREEFLRLEARIAGLEAAARRPEPPETGGAPTGG